MGLKKHEFKDLKEFESFELETHHKPIILGHVVLVDSELQALTTI